MKLCVQCSAELPTSARRCPRCATIQPEQIAGAAPPALPTPAEPGNWGPNAYAPGVAAASSGDARGFIPSPLHSPNTSGPVSGGLVPQDMRPWGASPGPYGHVPPSNFDPRDSAERRSLPSQSRRTLPVVDPRSAFGALLAWQTRLSNTMLVCGAVLFAVFLAPWRVGDPTLFVWNLFSEASAGEKIVLINYAVIGASAVVAVLMPINTVFRGFAAIILGLTAPCFAISIQPTVDWHSALLACALPAIISALFLRASYPSSRLARWLATLGAVGTFAVWVLPIAAPTAGGSFSLVGTLTILTGTHDPRFFAAIFGDGVVYPMIGVIPMVLVVSSLVVWHPAARVGARVLGWGLVAWPVIARICAALATRSSDLASIGEYLFLPLGTSAWLALSASGFVAIATDTQMRVLQQFHGGPPSPPAGSLPSQHGLPGPGLPGPGYPPQHARR